MLIHQNFHLIQEKSYYKMDNAVYHFSASTLMTQFDLLRFFPVSKGVLCVGTPNLHYIFLE
jgi:hypothetical protein